MEASREDMSSYLAQLYNQPVGRMEALVAYFEDEDGEALGEAIRRHIDNDHRIPSVALVNTQLREIRAESSRNKARRAEPDLGKVPMARKVVEAYMAATGRAAEADKKLCSYVRRRFHIHGNLDGLFIAAVRRAIIDPETHALPENFEEHAGTIDQIANEYYQGAVKDRPERTYSDRVFD
jgi:hypothetical protein